MFNILQKNFRAKPLAVAVASVISLSTASMTYAQDDGDEIIVTGIKASLQAAMDIKRESDGVVDAISAEDMGKFPDTNLAESLQRITGVSIDRTNGEGSKITVRGFGDQNNMVTLNGRTMPAAGVYGGGGTSSSNAGATRGFDFANLASESVSGVQVYKTGKANIATGGIGATVNISTMKPLEREGFKASIGGKALNDSTNRTGDDVTPELSGLVSWSNETFGVGLTASHQERDSGSSSIWVNEWNIGRWAEDHNTNAVGQTTNNKGLYRFTPGVSITNKPAVGQVYARPNDIRYIFSDVQRERDNAQLTLQWAPTDKITTSLDYTYAQNDIEERRGESTSWLDNGTSIDNVVFDGNKNIASPLYIHETQGPRDQGYEQQLRTQTNTLKSVGFNVAFEATENLTLNFDAHNSKMESLPTGVGGAGQISATIGTPTQISHSLDFRGDAPLFNMALDDSKFKVNEDGTTSTVRNGNNNGQYDIGDVGSQVVRIYANNQINEISEVKLNGVFEFEGNHFDFGVESRAMENSNAQHQEKYMVMGDWGIAAPGDLASSSKPLIQNFDYAGMYDDFDTSKSFHGGFKGNAEDIAAYLTNLYKSKGTAGNPYCVCINPALGTNSIVEEDTQSAYVQLGVKGEFAGMATNFLVGLRYETTDVTSSALVTPPLELTWLDNNDFTTKAGTASQQFKVEASYDNMLPNMDFDIALTDDIKARASFGKTIARAGYGSMNSAVSGYGSGGGSTALGATRSATAGNPGLLPLESTNTDVSIEWYYDDSSYVSAGVFEKRVKNFIGSASAPETLFNIKDQSNAKSPRVIAARAALASIPGVAVDDNSLFTMMVILDNPADFPGGASEYTSKGATLAQQIAIATKYDISVRADDPVATWNVSRPSNNKEAKLYGAEFAAQHFFGDSGFGLQANYTIVRGDVGFNDYAEPRSAQFALFGLSDTANLVAIYEKNDIQARVAYNWRDQYLSGTRSNAVNPVYVEAYSQIDANISYNLTEALTISLEGLNLLGSDTRSHERSESMLSEMYDLGPRYTIGARYNF
ncbi:MAG: TonB-dependent receptor [Cellvibrio sp.]